MLPSCYIHFYTAIDQGGLLRCFIAECMNVETRAQRLDQLIRRLHQEWFESIGSHFKISFTFQFHFSLPACKANRVPDTAGSIQPNL